MLRTYYALTKPGIIYGNAITAAAGFFLASKGHIDWPLLLETLIGLSLVVGSACVFNNYIDRDIDKKMARTKKRAIASGQVSGPVALSYASLLGALGFLVLGIYTNLKATLTALLGFFVYVFLYGFSKRRSSWGTIIGSVSGATPPVVGYLAVSNHLNSAAILLFLLLVFWQMPHFYSIAIYRLREYKAAGLPVLPIKKSVQNTMNQIVLYICGFIIVTLMLTIFGYTGFSYLLVAAALGLYWLRMGLRGFNEPNVEHWARGMFKASLVVITALSILISVDSWLP